MYARRNMDRGEVWLTDRTPEGTATPGADRFVIATGRHAADSLTIEGFALGEDMLRLAHPRRADPFVPVIEMGWADGDGDGDADDLQLLVGQQTVWLTDLAQQVAFEPISRLAEDGATDTEGWIGADAWFGAVAQIASGTDGTSHLRATAGEIGTSGIYTGPFNDLIDSDQIPFEPFTLSTSVYLDTTADGSGWAPGEGFELSLGMRSFADTATDPAATSGYFGDYIFHATQDSSTGQLVVAASLETDFAPREDLEDLPHAIITEDGWYTIEHRAEADETGALSIQVTLRDADEIVFQTTLSDPARLAAEADGNPDYAWLTAIGIEDGVALRDLALTYDSDQIPPLPDLDDLLIV